MADFDKLYHVKGTIINFIEEKARELYYETKAGFNFSPWVQVALLIEKAIVPCDYYIVESLLEFVQEVIDDAKSHNYKVERYQITSDGKKTNELVFDYTESIEILRKWLKDERENNTH